MALEKQVFTQLLTYTRFGGSVQLIMSERARERKRERGGERLFLLTCQG